jgi:hypothetical protein
MDPIELYVQQRRREMEADARVQRQLREPRALCRRPSPVLRLYARLWWASRPRVWTPALFESAAR